MALTQVIIYLGQFRLTQTTSKAAGLFWSAAFLFAQRSWQIQSVFITDLAPFTAKRSVVWVLLVTAGSERSDVFQPSSEIDGLSASELLRPVVWASMQKDAMPNS